MNHLGVVLQVLKDHKLFSKYSKCEFWLRSITFLSQIIFSDGVEVDPRKIEAVKNFPRPLTPTDIRSFLGYYRRFVDGFASIASPLNTLTKKCKKFEWSNNVREVFKC